MPDFDSLTNDGLIDAMSHSWERYKAVHPSQINIAALWQQWIRR